MRERSLLEHTQKRIDDIDKDIFDECGEWPADSARFVFSRSAPAVLQTVPEGPRRTPRRVKFAQSSQVIRDIIAVNDPWDHCEESTNALCVFSLLVALALCIVAFVLHSDY